MGTWRIALSSPTVTRGSRIAACSRAELDTKSIVPCMTSWAFGLVDDSSVSHAIDLAVIQAEAGKEKPYGVVSCTPWNKLCRPQSVWKAITSYNLDLQSIMRCVRADIAHRSACESFQVRSNKCSLLGSSRRRTAFESSNGPGRSPLKQI